MRWTWIKKWMPRGLYGRAALILIVPIVTVQLVVSIAYLQRYFEDVTQQLSVGLGLEIEEIANVLADTGPEAATDLARALAIDLQVRGLEPLDAGREDHWLWHDLTGGHVVYTLRGRLPSTLWIDLSSRPRWVEMAVPLEEDRIGVFSFRRDRISASNPHQLFVIMILTGGVMTAVAFLFLRNQLRPIRRLARAADAFGKGNHIAYKPSGALEVRAAGNAFLDMRARIERQIEQRTLMLSGVSHDLRTPLTRLKLGLSLMEAEEGKDELLQDVQEMEALLNIFLDFTRSDAQDETEDVDPCQVARDVAAKVGRAGGAVELVLPEDAPLVTLRPDALARALGNLVSNAQRYGSRVRLSVQVTDRATRFSVEDDGPGIPEKDREAALRPFERLDKSRNPNEGGCVGLGLAIVNDIARSHGGSLRLSQSEDFGGLRADLVVARMRGNGQAQ